MDNGSSASSPETLTPLPSAHGRPQLDQKLRQLEDSVLKQLHAPDTGDLSKQVGKLSLGATGGSKSAVASSEYFPVRPAFGTKGDPVLLWANFFALKVKTEALWKYTVTISERSKKDGGQPKPVKGRKLYFVMEQVLRYFGDKVLIATEFKSQLVTREKLVLEENPFTVEVSFESNPAVADLFDVTIHGPFEARVDEMLNYLTDQRLLADDHVFPRFPESVDALNVILGHGPRSQINRITGLGSSRFFPYAAGLAAEAPLNQRFNPRPLAALRGFFQSTRPATGQLLLNANVTCGVFRQSGNVSVLFESLGIQRVPSPQNPRDGRLKSHILSVSKLLRKARVWVKIKIANGTIVKRSKAIHDLVTPFNITKAGSNPAQVDKDIFFASPRNIKFYLKEGDRGQYISVADHYERKYGIRVGGYPVLNLGTTARPSFYPAESVEIQPGQAVKAKLLQDETTKMLDHACKEPDINAGLLETDARRALMLESTLLTSFGISVDRKLLTVEGRKLIAPSVSFLKNNKPSPVPVSKGSWNYRACKVVRGANIGNWSVVQISLGRDYQMVTDDELQVFEKFMKESGLVASTRVPCNPPVISRQDAEGSRLENIFKWAKKNQIKFLLVIFSARADSSLYGRVKVLGDCEYGIHTSCMVGTKMTKGGSSYAANIVLKLNLKAGGINQILTQDIKLLKAGKTMVIGYDVTHPTNMPETKGSGPPSLVGMVASTGADLAQWPSTTWEQTSKQEMLDDTLVEKFKHHLDIWRKRNNSNLPANIIIFRDGVSEGQFSQVLEQELTYIKEACRQKYGPKAQPRFTIVISVKRHQTRFYPAQEGRAEGSAGNIEAGTVVDRGVTQARYWDFYLTAHHALKGTARPAHYTVLMDEIFRAEYKQAAADELEKLTHELCYLFGRATKAVSICPPAYYADIVCERARVHRPEMFDVSDAETTTTIQTTSSSPAQGRKVHPDLADSMYYI